MKPAILAIFFTAVFAGHYFAQSQTSDTENQMLVQWFQGDALRFLDEAAHQSHTGTPEIPVVEHSLVKNYAETHEAVRQQLASECQSIDSAMVVRIKLDKRGRYEDHAFLSEAVEDSGYDQIFANLSLKKMLLKGVRMFDLQFDFASGR
ncbi:MAG: hypothetical protein AB8F95_13050 [Bacteroidia bacterium]